MSTVLERSRIEAFEEVSQCQSGLNAIIVVEPS